MNFDLLGIARPARQALSSMALLAASACMQSMPAADWPTQVHHSELLVSQSDPQYTIPNYRAHWADEPRPPIPVFIITCDRLTWLKRTLTGLQQAIDWPIDVVIHDNHSTFPPMVAFLNELEQAGITVARHDQDLERDVQLENVRGTIEAWYLKHDAPYYVVTDPDIELTRHDGKLLDFYIHLLEAHPEVNVVGPMLRIDDLPDCYPFKSDILRNEAERAKRVPTFYEAFEGQAHPVTYGQIDTTLGVYRRSFRFRRVNDAVQAYAPYAARHLDWYLDPKNLTDDQAYYMRHASAVSHAGGTWLREVVEREKEATAPQ